MGKMPLKGWLMLMLGASRAPLNEQEARSLARDGKRGGREAGPARPTVVVPRPAPGPEGGKAAGDP